MRNPVEWLREKIDNMDGLSVGFWTCTIGAALLSLGASIFKTVRDNVKADELLAEAADRRVASRDTGTVV